MTEKYRENRLKEWIKTTLKYHIADSTAMIIESTPVFAVLRQELPIYLTMFP